MRLYKQILKFWKQTKNAFIVSGIFCLVSFLVGVFIPNSVKEIIFGMAGNYLENVEFSFSGILLNNLTAAVILAAGGFLLLIPTIISGGMNFVILGTALVLVVREFGALFFISAVVPHSIFEIPAIIIAITMGIIIFSGLVKFKWITGDLTFQEIIKWSGATVGLVVFPLLIIAAVIEVTLTPFLAFSAS